MAKLDVEPKPHCIPSRYSQCRCACLDRNDTRRRALLLESKGDGTAACAQIHHARKIALQSELDQQLGLRARDEDGRVHRHVDAVELLVADDVRDRLSAFSLFY